MPNVSFIRPEVAKLLPLYSLIRDCISGEVTVKEARQKYLPMPNPTDCSKENKARYDQYIQRAVFYNVARRTLFGLIGQVFMRDPVIEVPTLLEPLVENATGTGINLIQLSKKAVEYNLSYSRAGLMVDYPVTDENTGSSLADLESGSIRPIISVYAPHEIINWRTMERGAEEIISLVVLFETWCVMDDGFELTNAPQFRVLRLDDNGEYIHEIWREVQPTKSDGQTIPRGNFILHTVFHPKDSAGQPIREIPFMFIGSENNDPSPDNPNFYDLASLNIAHYRNSADYEESCFIVGQPTPVIIGVDQHWIDNVLKGVIQFGSRGGIPLPVGGEALLLQATENTMIKEAMDTKERQMVALGARLVEQQQVQRTATEAELESTSEGSALVSSAKNVSDAFEWALKWAARWIGQPDEAVVFTLNSDFDISRITPEERRQVVEEWQKGAITFTEMRTSLRKAGIAIEEDNKAKAQIESDMVKQMALIEENTPDDKPSTV